MIGHDMEGIHPCLFLHWIFAVKSEDVFFRFHLGLIRYNKL